ncbi:hypothetical protein DDE18_08110 [Nocardioides gansuensis]|uniref:Uncharacterized protein n=1 Tax=Nocardioides gansuensis TaxID=2138300 RepID=A0A2T8FC27_9ACTN|nr:hypothetical protein [Nocardioides gansuensis]PVG83253.1 hypothetical protein DDE18_08110 [Nocardioides gansuensis]
MVIRLAVLAVAGIFSLPVTAYFLDGERTENWILPVQLLVMAALGALLWPKRLVGALIGVGMGLVGVAVFFLLLNGFEGA